MDDTLRRFVACSADQRGLASRQQLLAAGVTLGQLRAAVADGRLLRLRRGVLALEPLAPVGPYLLSGGSVDAAYLRHAQAVLLQLGPTSALRGRSAAVVWGLDMLAEPPLLEIQVGAGQTRVALVDVATCRTRASTQVVDGLRVTTLPATLRECARTRPLDEAVAILDSALRRELIKPVGLIGHGILCRAVALADPRCGSVLESALRVLLTRHGLAPPYTQLVVRDGSTFVARVDFCWPGQRLIVETDGRRWHDPVDARESDRRRTNACARLGWRVLRFTWAEVLHEPAYVIGTMRAALAVAA